MAEPKELRDARRCLAEAESDLRSTDSLAQLAEGLGLLEDVVETGAAADVRTARNLAASYAGKVYERVAARVSGDRQVPEPELEHYFKVVLAFDAFAASLPPQAAQLKIGVV